MSYSSPQSDGPRGNGYGYDDYGIPAYHEQGSSRHQNPSRPQQQQHYPQQQQYQSDPRMRFPRPQANFRAQPMEPSRNMYDGSDYGEQDQDQWPLGSQQAPAPRHQPPPQAHRQQPAGARSGPPPRPQRPDYVPPMFEPQRQPARSASADHYQQQPAQQRQQPRSASANHQPNYQQPVSQQSHHGTGQWTGDGYSYNTSPSSHGHPVVQHASYNKNIPPRPPLGPPPSSRRGPSSYYSKPLSDVHPIVEEAERASLTREVSREGEGGWGSQSGASMTSSNAIPIGIPRFYLDGRESGVSITPSSAYSEYAPDLDNSPPRREEPLRSFKQRMQQQDMNEDHDHMSSQQQVAAERQEARGMNEYFPPPPVEPQSASTVRGESPSSIPVRQASLGKRSKPTLTTVKSGDRMRSRGNSASNDALSGLPSQQKRAAEKQQNLDDQKRQQPREDARSGADRSVPLSTHADDSPTAPPPLRAAGMTSSNASFLDSSSESAHSTRPSAPLESPKPSIRVVQSKENLTTPKPTYQSRGRSPLAKTDDDDEYDPRSKEMMLEDPEKDPRGGLLREDSDTLKSPTGGFSGQRVGRRRPARLDVDAIRDEEARGSLSSLSDLIKRATRLASNLDRGRTASRLGMEGWLGPGNGNGNSNSKNNSSGELAKYRRSAGSLNDMLAAFPPPGVPTPTGHENRSLANWSSRRSSRPLPSDSDAASRTRSRKQRRCCGIPLWLFITLLLLLLALVAAAAVIPVVLIVLPGQKDDSPSSSQSQTTGTQAATLSKCATKLTCENGGQAFPTSGSDEDTCRCLCVNSFTGPTCSTQSTAGCTSIAVSGMQKNATIGNAIPRLLSLAEANYNLQLESQTLIGLFNEADLDCASENALVTFGGKAQKLRRVAAPQASQTDSAQPAEATSNGIVFDNSPSPSQTTTSTSSSPSPTSSAPASTRTVDVDFARAAVLYILQSSSSLQDAESAQKALQDNLNGAKGGLLHVGDWTVDLDGKKVTKA